MSSGRHRRSHRESAPATTGDVAPARTTEPARHRARQGGAGPFTKRTLAPLGLLAAAGLVTGSVGVIVAAQDGTPPDNTSINRPTLTNTSVPVRVETDRFSRGQVLRLPAAVPVQQAAEPVADRSPIEFESTGKRYLTTALNVWTGAGEDNELIAVLDTAERVKITGVEVGEWAQILYQGKPAWVRAAYLSTTAPVIETEEPTDATETTEDPADTDDSGSTETSEDTEAPDDGTDDSGGTSDEGTDSGGLSTAPCSFGTSIESGLTSNAVTVYRAVCAEFPGLVYGGLRPGDDGFHGTGQALDVMVDPSTGDSLAQWCVDNAGALGISECIWSREIWTDERSSEGWRYMEDRGSVTANHEDHVHISVY